MTKSLLRRLATLGRGPRDGGAAPHLCVWGALALGVIVGACSSSDSSDSGAATSSPGSAEDGGASVGADSAVSGGDASVGGGGGGVSPPPSAVCAAPEAAADTSTVTSTVGTGTADSCTEGALATAAAKGGVIVFNCGASPTTIHVNKTIELRTDIDTVIDGGGKITLDGGDTVQVLRFDHPNYRVNDTKLTLQHLTIAHGKIAGTHAYAPAPAPCSTGFYDGYGGALYFRDGVLLVVDVAFLSNNAEPLGPDVGGGAISLQGAKKATFIGSVFQGNSGSNGGAIESLNSDFDVYDSTFDSNTATGNGANSDDAKKCSVVAENKQHQVGSGGNGGAVAIDGGSDTTHTFCGVRFTNNKAGKGALGGALGRTPDLSKQTTVIDRCVFDGNSGDSAGAAYFHNSTLQIKATTFHANKAGGSGALQTDGTTFDFENVTFSENEATATGGVAGAIAAFGVDGKIVNATFVGNKVDGFGAAIFGSPKLQIQNSLFANNVGQNPGAPMQCQVDAATSGSGDIQFPANHVAGTAPDAACVTGITFADPRLGALGDNGGPTPTALPAAGSPAIGAGKNCPATDQRGNPRKADGCTAGAVEVP